MLSRLMATAGNTEEMASAIIHENSNLCIGAFEGRHVPIDHRILPH